MFIIDFICGYLITQYHSDFIKSSIIKNRQSIQKHKLVNNEQWNKMIALLF